RPATFIPPVIGPLASTASSRQVSSFRPTCSTSGKCKRKSKTSPSPFVTVTISLKKGITVNPTALTLLSFAGLATTAAAVGMLVRDLVFGGRKENGTLIKRLPLARDTVAPTGPVSNLDQSFNRFVL